jgi:Tfp pilus assembly protein PilX
MNMRTPKFDTKNNEQGFASIVITLIIIIVLALLTVGFAQLARREQQSALTKQLSSQAFFAAESGINDVIKALPTLLLANAVTPISKDQCLSSTYLPRENLNVGTGVSYSCVLLNLQPPSLVYSEVGSASSRNTTFSTTNPINSIKVNWSSATNKTTFRPNLASGFSPNTPANWNSPAVVQVSLTPLGNGLLGRAALTSNTFTAYLYPTTGGGNVTYNPTGSGQGPIVAGNCDTTTFVCGVTINGVPGGAGHYYLLRLVNYYDTSNISVNEAKNTVTGATYNFVNGQAQIDSTGRARTVLKRLQVRVSLTGNSSSGAGTSVNLPDTTIEASNICKRPETEPTVTNYIDTNGSVVSSGEPCDLNN